MSWIESTTTVFCDFGNSSLKLCWNRRVHSFPYTHDPEWTRHASELLRPLSTPVLFIATVVPQRTAEFLSELRRREENCLICWMTDLLPPTNPAIPYEGVRGIGIDRILGLLGARRFFLPPLITVDCGTAVTINLLSAEGKCLGGAIFAGAALQLQALATHTALLPSVKAPSTSVVCIGSTTEEALLSGTFASVLGGIQLLISTFAHSLGAVPAVILTGGGSQPFAATLQQWWHGQFAHRPYLVLEGMQYAVEQLPPEQIRPYVQPLDALPL